MFILPPKSDATWVYDDPSGVPEAPYPVYTAAAESKPKGGKVVRLPVSTPAIPKAA
jgi:hypothetical protein